MTVPQNAPPSVPADFDAERYVALNQDLAGLTQAAAAHYLAFGRIEGRRYRDDHVEGFDPDHFRETHPGFAGEPDDVCREAWLEAGGHNGEPGRQGIHLARLELPLDRFPTAFPWRVYARLTPRAAMHRWAALSHFLEEGFARHASTLPYGPGAQDFLVAAGERFAGRGDVLALQAYELAAAAGPLSITARVRMAEIYARFGVWASAHEAYRALIAAGEHGADVLGGFVRVAADLGAWDRTLPVLEALPHLPGAVASEAAEAYFARQARIARAHYLGGERAEGDAALAAATMRLVAFLDRPHAPVPARPAGARRTVIMLVPDGLPETAHRRAAARATLSLDGGYLLRVVRPGEIDGIVPHLAEAAALVLFRMPGWPSLVRLVLAARRAGVPTVYETDELTFDPDHAPPPLASFGGMIGSRLYEDLVFGVALYRGAAALCDYGLAPNATLADRLVPLVRRHRAFVIRETVALAQPANIEPDSHLRLVLHATRAFELGIDSAAGAALFAAMRERPALRLTTVGHVRLSDAFAAVAPRVKQLGPDGDADAVTARADLNLVIPGEGVAEGCLAIRGWLDAARHGVATLAGATDAYREALAHGRDVWLAEDAAGWRAGFDTLLGEPARRGAIGNAARTRAGTHYAPAAVAADVLAILGHLRADKPEAPTAHEPVRPMTDTSRLMRLRRALARRLDPETAAQAPRRPDLSPPAALPGRTSPVTPATPAAPAVPAVPAVRATPVDTVDALFERLIAAALAGAHTVALDGSYAREIGPLVDGDSLEALSAEHLLAAAFRPGAALLDFGCGAMHHRTFVESLGYSWHGVDYLEGVSTTVRDSVAQLGGAVSFYDGITLPFADASFDVVWSMLVFQHIQSIDASFGEIARVLRPGGRVIGQIAYLEQMQDFGTFNYTPYGLKVAARNAGLRLTRVDPKHDVFSFLLRRLIVTFTASDDTPLNRMMGADGFYHAQIIATGRRLGLDTRMINLLRLLFCTHFVFEIEKPAGDTA